MQIKLNGSDIAIALHEWATQRLPQFDLAPEDVEVYSIQCGARTEASEGIDPEAVINIDASRALRPEPLPEDPWEALMALGVTKDTADLLKRTCEYVCPKPTVAHADDVLAVEIGECIVRAIREAINR